MVLGVMEGQIRGGYFPDSILAPSVVDHNGQPPHGPLCTRTVSSSVVLSRRPGQKGEAAAQEGRSSLPLVTTVQALDVVCLSEAADGLMYPSPPRRRAARQVTALDRRYQQLWQVSATLNCDTITIGNNWENEV